MTTGEDWAHSLEHLKLHRPSLWVFGEELPVDRVLSYRDNLDTLLRVWRDEQPALTIPDTEYVFSTEREEQMSPNRINQLVRAAADNAGYTESYDTVGGERHEFSAHVF